jgi:hypothetical protein
MRYRVLFTTSTSLSIVSTSMIRRLIILHLKSVSVAARSLMWLTATLVYVFLLDQKRYKGSC